MFCFALLRPQSISYPRSRPALGAFFRQYYRYARGDGKADLWRWRHAARYLIYLVLVPPMVLLGFWQNRLWWLLFPAGCAVIFWTPYRRLLPLMAGYGLLDKIKAILLVPLIRVTGDVAKMTGYPAGVLWRMRR